MNIFETLKKLSENQRKPSYIYLDEQTNQIKEIPLSIDMAGSALNSKQNPAKEIHDSIF